MRNSLRGVISVFLFACLAALVAFAPAAAWGQSSSSGTIMGVVTDNTNAVVPGATVTITEAGTGASRTTTTNEVGRYIFASVQPGSYDLKVSQQGFVTTVVPSLVVQVGLQVTENAKLQVGAVSTTVTVTENPGAELQTLDATVGATLSGAMIINLPNQSRDASTLALFQPGQNLTGNVGGTESDQNSFQLDGGFATDDMSGDNNTYIKGFGSDTTGGAATNMHTNGIGQAPSAVIPIPVSSVEEFKVSTSNQTADFNGGAGSQVQLITKRGTSAFHGGVYDYYLDNNFGGANTWDNNSRGAKQPGSHFSRFGASAGGKIPHSNFAGGDWFIFGNYEGFRFPQSAVFRRSFPTASMRLGLIKLSGANYSEGEVVNINNANTTDPATGTIFAANSETCVGVTTSTGLAPCGSATSPIAIGTVSACPNGGCDPRTLGMNPTVQALWNTYLPLPNDCGRGDGVNYCTFDGSIGTPQSSNFGVARIDHDFAKNEHFNGTYHYYKLTNTVNNQWDIGGFFPGDVKGQYSAIRQKPQVPWYYTAGLTTDVSSNVTNDVHFSYTRNWWAYASPSGVPNVAGFPAALEIGGETNGADTFNLPLFGPYNTNNQSVRTRYWNGHDSMYRDDVTWIKGNHLFQFGGNYLRANDTHNRNDNGQSINTFAQYLIGDGFGTDLTTLNMSFPNMPADIAAGADTTNYENLYSQVLGMVNQSQSLYTRGIGSRITGLPLDSRGSCAIAGIAATSACISSPPLTNNSIIPTYNVYLTDSWHLKPTLSLNYGLGYTVEMPPFETQGGVQTVMVDANGNMFRAQQYLNSEKQAALQGIAFQPQIGFSAIRNVNGHSKYPYDPFFHGISPRIGLAWNMRPDTVLRAGFSTIFGRINGVDPILVPMLTPGLLQPAVCLSPTNTGTCGTAGTKTTPANSFRVGTGAGFDGVNAPLAAPSPFLPQPWFPGFNDVATGSGETIDANFHPDRSDELTVSVQHQFGPKIIAEAGYIGRKITNEMQYYSLTAVPYMMTQGGQTFANAWAGAMLATNYGTGRNTATNFTNGFGDLDFSTITQQPFFEAGLSSNYLAKANADIANYNTTNAGATGFVALNACPNLTCAFVTESANGPVGSHLMKFSDPFDAWAAVSNGGFFAFPGRTFTSDPIRTTCTTPTGNGCGGQSPSLVTQMSTGYGNYNAGYMQFTTTDWHGLTAKTNFTYSSALGTGNFVQASSSVASVDPWNIQNNYGPQQYNEKFVFNMFFNYAEPFYASQKGVIGHLLGGWSISPLFVWGSGYPVELGTANGNCGSFGECNTSFIAALENGVITKDLNYSATRKASSGGPGPSGANCGTAGQGFNVFSDPTTSCPSFGGILGDPVRNPILGLDGQMGGGGPLTGLPFWNLDLGMSKKVKIMEKLSGTMHFDFTNVTNHMQPADPTFNIFSKSSWGVLGGGGNLQGNDPRRLQFGLTLDW
ncbi:MAG TPA: carboxypeptidase-like regulatory domain-containing protein [Candidatus Acidoferrum sp.]|nr:carboxypeptidase-like regulatory domain-containing protein [Candidatus Acidoferrum sp.]